MTHHYRAIVILAGLALGGCPAPATFDSYQDAIGTFRTATDQTAVVASKYILSINEFERGLVYADLEADPARKLNIVEDLLEQRIDPAAVRTRALAFDVLRRYTDTLAALASSDAGERWKAEAGLLAAGAKELSSNLADPAGAGATRLGSLLGDDPEKGPLAVLAGAVGEALIDKRRAQALDEVVVKYKPAIDRISALLRQDFDFVAKRRRFVALAALQPLGEAYNDAVKRRDNAGRLAQLRIIKRAVAEYEQKVVEIAEIQQALDGFDSAHAGLVAYARSDKGPDSLGALVGEIQRYGALAQTLYAAWKAGQAP